MLLLSKVGRGREPAQGLLVQGFLMSLPTVAILGSLSVVSFCITRPLSMHSHSDSKLLIMFFTPSKMQLSSRAFPLALQIRYFILRAPCTTSPWLHKSASEPRETSELSGCNNSWWEPGFCCIIPPRDWAGGRKGQGWGSQGLLSSRS